MSPPCAPAPIPGSRTSWPRCTSLPGGTEALDRKAPDRVSRSASGLRSRAVISRSLCFDAVMLTIGRLLICRRRRGAARFTVCEVEVMSNGHRVTAGLPHPLGASRDGSGVNVAVFSAHATGVQLWSVRSRGKGDRPHSRCRNSPTRSGHGYFPDLRPGQFLRPARRGPYAPRPGTVQRQQAAARSLCQGDRRARSAGMTACIPDRPSQGRPVRRDRRDSARAMPKCQIIDTALYSGPDRRPRRPWPETVIYEAHVRGNDRAPSRHSRRAARHFTALAAPGVIEHLARLGVTAIELLPIQAFFDDRYLTEKGLANYWGYNTPRLLRAGALCRAGLSTCTSSRPDGPAAGAGIEVIPTWSTTHTAEGIQRRADPELPRHRQCELLRLADDPRYTYETTGLRQQSEPDAIRGCCRW